MDKKGCLIIAVISLAGISLRGLVLSLLWGWFIVPLGLPAINIFHAYGLALLVGLFGNSPQSEKGSQKDLLIKAAAENISAPLGALLMGWIISGWM